MSADWCKAIELDISEIKAKLIMIEKNNTQLINVLTLGLLAIVGAVVGVKIIP